jgi:hypothetical protein
MKLPVSLLIIPIFSLVLSACTQAPKPRLTPADQPYVDLYADLMIVQNNTPLRDSLPIYRKTLDSVYHAHALDSAQLSAELQKFKSDPIFGREFYEKVIAHLEQEKKAIPPAPPPKLP